MYIMFLIACFIFGFIIAVLLLIIGFGVSSFIVDKFYK